MTGAGWDRTKVKITLLDEHWDSFKKSDNNKFLHLRTKGVDPELCELWDEVFGSMTHTWKNVMAPCLLKRKAIGNGKEPIIDLEDDRVDALMNTQGTDLDLLLDRELLDDDTTQRELVSWVRPDTPFDEFMENVYDSMTNPLGVESPLATGNGPLRMTSNVHVRKIADGLTFRELLKKKHKSAVSSFNEHMRLVNQTRKNMLSIMEEECDITVHGASLKQFEFSDCFEVIKHMVKDNMLKDHSNIWCFAVTKLGNQEARNQFMQLKRDDSRLSWLEFEYNNHYKIYDPNDRDEYD